MARSILFLQLIFHILLHAIKMARSILFLLEIFSHDSGIIDSLLGFFFGVLGFLDCFFDFISDLDQFLFHLSLLIGQKSILRVKEIGSFGSFMKFTISSLSAFFCLLNS